MKPERSLLDGAAYIPAATHTDPAEFAKRQKQRMREAQKRKPDPVITELAAMRRERFGDAA